MKSIKIFLVGLLLSSTLLALMLVSKPALAMIPPPAAQKPWLWDHPDLDVPSKTITVKVEWKEGVRTENVTLKTFLKNVK